MEIKLQNYNFKNQISISNYGAYTKYNPENLHNWALVAVHNFSVE
jgi:hypothetical protein